MNSPRVEQPEIIRKAFPGTWYYPKWRLVTWHPRGRLDDAFADQVVNFIEMEETIQDAPFDRYTDFSGLTEIRIKLPHLFEIARFRRSKRQPVKSAFFARDPIMFAVAQTYEWLMDQAMIEVRAFQEQKAAAEWLGVPPRILRSPSS